MTLSGKKISAQPNIADTDYANDAEAPGFGFGPHGTIMAP
jgi:hypothetical protein